MMEEVSFGVVPLSQESGRWEVFLVQHLHGGHWGLPKGRAVAGETPMHAAFRELKEETNLSCLRMLKEDPLEEEYFFIREGQNIRKKVFYFVAEVSGSVRLQAVEIANGIWLPLEEAIVRASYAEAKSILGQAAKIVSEI